MSEMVDRVAAAMEDIDAQWQEIGRDNSEEGQHERYRLMARAAIAVMWESTEAMLGAGQEKIWDFSPDYAPIDRDPKGQREDSAEYIGKQAWQAMIGEALK